MIKKKVYGIGNPLIDIIVNITDEELHSLGLHKGTMNLIDNERRIELTEFIKTKSEISYSCGGSCPNTIITLSTMGIHTTLSGKVGNDEYGKIYKEKLSKLRVKDNLLFSDIPTGSSIIFVTPDSDRTMNTFLGANRYFCTDDIIEEDLNKSDFFHFTGYMWDTQNQKDAIKKALSIAHAKGITVSFDLGDMFAVGRYKDSFLDIIKHDCNIVFANKEEARIMFDNYDAYECCKSMGKLCETAIVKNGKKGSFISHKQKIYSIPVQGPNIPVDTTGAGDTYSAGFIYGLCSGFDIYNSGISASVLAGQIIKQRGAQFAHDMKDSLAELINKTIKEN